MSDFISDDFILGNDYARRLYFDHAEKMPIIDYHNHLPPDDILSERVFKNITEAWLEGDHYKWRAMRALGVDESLITGNASDEDKFLAWAQAVPHTMRNPLYHWTHLELKRYFGIGDLLNGNTGKAIFDESSQKINSTEFSAVKLLEMMDVEVVCSTDDPADSLHQHTVYAQSPRGNFKMFPTFRPDKSMNIEKEDFLDYLDKLGATEDTNIEKVVDLIEVLDKRVVFFNNLGGKASDYGLDTVYSLECGESTAENIFQKRRDGQLLSELEISQFKSFVLEKLCRMYYKVGWVQQFHVGALRNNSGRMLEKLGPDTGFDSMGDQNHAENMSRLFNKLDSDGVLTKTIVYNVNPRDNATFATMAGNFNDGSVRGKMQWGSGWWFLDQKNGMEDQMNVLSDMGLLSLFVGMLTDSRSFLSFPRHEYFRRILCNLLGNDIEKGLLPKSEIEFIGNMVEDICYNNVKEYLNF
ncbi:glucuronate isomerase [Membranihabitans maritimus]|uniref:glucuronate isomerase n=1 Tax=Membranihabitans maritimus TaxID=2904244 RepID=UPI001F00255B|nr:glucuronate isomerase [Membranihabitans maritimus]